MSRSHRPPGPEAPATRSRSRDVMVAGAALVIGLLAVTGAVIGADGARPAATVADEVVSDRIEALGLVVEGSTIDLGTVPLDVTVTPMWTLTNASTAPITLGEPHASVLEGCCPGPLTLSSTVVDPGESAVLTFPLQMHAGMDGPHDFDVHVPVVGTDRYLTLRVVGFFGA